MEYKSIRGGDTLKAKNTSEIFYDELHDCNRSKLETLPVRVWHEGRFITSHNRQIFGSIMQVSRHIKTLSTGNPAFKQHSGFSLGGAKKFATPRGEAYGMELEMCFNGENEEERLANKLRFAEFIYDNLPEWTCERDGSLEDNASDGYVTANLELVSPPLSYQAIVRQLSAIIPVAQKYKAFTYDTFFGLHITANLGKSNDKSAERFIDIINSNPKFWDKASGRPGSKYLKKYAPFYNLSSFGGVYDLYHSGSHNYAVFPRNDKGSAVEVRIFKCEIDLQYLKDKLDLVRSVYQYAKSDKDIKDYYKCE